MRNNLTWLYSFLLGFSFLFSCNIGNDGNNEPIEIDFSESGITENQNISTDSSVSLKVAISTMLSPSETFLYYEKLFSHIAKKINKPIEFKQRRTYEEVNTLLETNQVDLAFICSGAYIDMDNKSIAELIAIPVCDGKPLYRAYMIVHNSSGIEKFEDLRGESFFDYSDILYSFGRFVPYVFIN